MNWKSFNESYNTYSIILNQVLKFQNEIYNQNYQNKNDKFDQYFNKEIKNKINSLKIECNFLKERIISKDYDLSIYSLERSIRLQHFLKEWRTTLISITWVLMNSNYPNYEIQKSKSINVTNTCEMKSLSSFRDCSEFYCPELVVIPTGSFLMGASNEEVESFGDHLTKNEIKYSSPLHKVTIKKRFAMSSKEVTLDEFRQFINETNYSLPRGCETVSIKSPPDFTDNQWNYELPGFVEPNSFQNCKQPVVCVRREDGRNYAEWLSKKTGQQYRLPNEIEWEYTARANTGNNFYLWGNDTKDACKYANVEDLSASRQYGFTSNLFPCDDGNGLTAIVGSYLPNSFKIYDMTGNAREWMDDCWHDSFENAPSESSTWNYDDLETNPMCRFGVLRGGSWIYDFPHQRIAYRNAYYSSQARSNMWGFRLIRIIDN